METPCWASTNLRFDRGIGCRTKVYFVSMAKGLTQSLDEFEQTETPEESYTPEQLEKGQRMLARIREAVAKSNGLPAWLTTMRIGRFEPTP